MGCHAAVPTPGSHLDDWRDDDDLPGGRRECDVERLVLVDHVELLPSQSVQGIAGTTRHAIAAAAAAAAAGGARRRRRRRLLRVAQRALHISRSYLRMNNSGRQRIKCPLSLLLRVSPFPTGDQ
jgi:hypothetical protein